MTFRTRSLCLLLASLVLGRAQPAPAADPPDFPPPTAATVPDAVTFLTGDDFGLDNAKREQVRAIGTRFQAERERWRRDHAADAVALRDKIAAYRKQPGGATPQQWREIEQRRQDIAAGGPDPAKFVSQMDATLTAEQREQFAQWQADPQGEAGFDSGQAKPPHMQQLPANGVPTTPGFYKLKFRAPATPGHHAVTMTYILYLPTGYDATTTARPTLVFLHGSGEVGVDGNALFAMGPAAEVANPANAAMARAFPFVLVCPQCPPRGERWDQPVMLDAVLALLDDVKTKVRIDADRTYVTGLSMGGKGTWLLAGRDPDRFAAIAPISASTLDLDLARRLRYESVHAIDGADDQDDGAAANRAMVQADHEVGGDTLLTILPNEGHFVWGHFYNSPAFYEWFLTHRRLTPQERRDRDATTRPAR